MCAVPSIFICSVADAGVVAVIITVPGSAPTRELALPQVPIRSEMAPSCEPCADNRPDDMRMKLFSREKGDAKLQRNR